MWRWISYPLAAFAGAEATVIALIWASRHFVNLTTDDTAAACMYSLVGIVSLVGGAFMAEKAVAHWVARDARDQRREDEKIKYDREQREKLEEAIGMLTPSDAEVVVKSSTRSRSKA